ncbi:MAG TPA: D-glycero-beta-D-manno-heptose 1-phosphate adenylyltransferase, partial [Abditibacterium sp.]
MKNLITDRDLLAKTLENTRANRKIVFTNGCFDILHVGHVELLEKARNLGDFLVVGVNSDASVKRLKGESRPIHDQNARAQVLAALKSVDAVVIFEENTPIETIAVLRPDIHVKGGDYKPDDLPEAATVRENGGEIAIISLVEGFSSSRAIEQLKMAP